MKVYDAFLFFNELDLLEIRLNELDSVVDVFVLLECTKTFSFKDKPLYYLENKERFEKFAHKIKHVIVDDTPDNLPADPVRGHNRHKIEQWQRAQLDRGVIDCQPDDVILISDIDEIPRAENITKALDMLNRQNFVGFEQRFFYYYLNGLCVQNGREAPWNGPVAVRKSNYIGAQKMRDDRGIHQPDRIRNAGWHFSYLGGVEKIIEKLESFAHAEHDNSNIKSHDRLAQKIAAGQDIFDRANKPTQKYIAIDSTFPKYILDNLEKFGHLIKR